MKPFAEAPELRHSHRQNLYGPMSLPPGQRYRGFGDKDFAVCRLARLGINGASYWEVRVFNLNCSVEKYSS